MLRVGRLYWKEYFRSYKNREASSKCYPLHAICNEKAQASLNYAHKLDALLSHVLLLVGTTSVLYEITKAHTTEQVGLGYMERG